jgi:hypothetical protein
VPLQARYRLPGLEVGHHALGVVPDHAHQLPVRADRGVVDRPGEGEPGEGGEGAAVKDAHDAVVVGREHPERPAKYLKKRMKECVNKEGVQVIRADVFKRWTKGWPFVQECGRRTFADRNVVGCSVKREPGSCEGASIEHAGVVGREHEESSAQRRDWQHERRRLSENFA